MNNLTLHSKPYNELLKDLQIMIQKAGEKAQATITRLRVETYWKMGRRLHQERSLHDGANRSGIMRALAVDLGLDPSLLSRIYGFYQQWPQGVRGDAVKLGWSQHLELSSVKSDTQRQYYLKEALEQNWSTRDLRRAVQKDLYGQKQSKEKNKPTKLMRTTNPMNVYRAKVENVVDGDTLVVQVDVGFDVWVKQRLRLRGIDAAPREKDQGARAKEFVQTKLQDLHSIVIRTFKTDIYGRYVADVFYHPTLKERQTLFEKGFYLNEDLVKEGLAQVVDF